MKLIRLLVLLTVLLLGTLTGALSASADVIDPGGLVPVVVPVDPDNPVDVPVDPDGSHPAVPLAPADVIDPGGLG